MAKAQKVSSTTDPRRWELLRNRECELAGITLLEFGDFSSTDETVRIVQHRVIWRMNTDLHMKPPEIDTWLQCPPKRVTEALLKEPPALPSRVAKEVGNEKVAEQRQAKIDTVLAAAVKYWSLDKHQLRTKIGLPDGDAVIGAILLVLEYQHVASFHVIEHIGCMDREAAELLSRAERELRDSTSPLYHGTRGLCEALRINFGHLQANLS